MPKIYEEILGISIRARHREEIGIKESENLFKKPILHRQISGNKVYTPFKLWEE
ncbi:hypothetical protein [Neobacillus terrae]|uniref:hypothetical protein n=1 Tax=Neobacillus terrae TaxID=3034837 RepID=UPI00140A797F|nr:hypothetical protein [Neobacillus terrae]NHM33043.1 hypothetical protein [Neobacillus terrae]